MSYALDIDGREFQPIPESWLDHPEAYDRDQRGGPRLLAVSVHIGAGPTLRVRYASVSGQVLVCQTAGERHETGVVPRALVNRSGWPRSLRPGPNDPIGHLRLPEWDHLEALWSDRLDEDLAAIRERDDTHPHAGGGARA